MEYTREKLIELCEKSFVQQVFWRNRDSSDAQLGVAKCLALLKCGCEFEIQTNENNPNGNCVTDEDTIWIQFFVHNFGWFEGVKNDIRGNTGNWDDSYHYYIPTEKRLESVNGGDWY